ncbi:hypothetical protein EMIHUDRAFT_115912 [Emiliania huxleyi CCMP1516]|uniref:Dimethylsulfoniopropionate lyase 5 n=2 Tax=Emiliania huxleyi (strain CCMP1516) TaxID=280463 RepID=ALMA5_EMIH1|nr:hypothetical protein EMIHUDRAFT_115912 [Emiliania huxleyi CCMP1516]R1ENF4.1 RecName: Full=Dimethylsulfonioproprionate lyase 5; Short=DMSP lyase 5; AltName: Full=Dimethylpropiothetin dethiomethylase 5 [Emiliania huxleyi]EOD24466.1 hypothetical protein EMIHUDRAFT_115912 [Emiliania huxleyi CCMP1516]|eukprot:XP_005776895.1 hypothetical protein EMIHUDRAFT_115912 [Emiliania huxleyi CCMP1516]
MPAQAVVGTNSYLFRTVHAEVKGLRYLDVRAGKELSVSQKKALKEAVKELDAEGVVAITGDCGSFVHYQTAVRRMTKTPAVLSPLLQAPLLATMYMKEETILVLTNDSSDYDQAALESNLVEIGLSQEDAARFVIQGLQHIEGFSTSEVADMSDERTWAMVDTSERLRLEIMSTIEAAKKANPSLRAILLESTLLPSFSDSMRQTRGVPVFDAITLADYLAAASTDNPRFGSNIDASVWSSAMERANVMDELSQRATPAIGILRIDYSYPPAPGDVDYPGSYYYRTVQEVAAGLTFEAAQEGRPLTAQQREAMEGAIRRLEAAKGVVGITGDCGFLMNYQVDARRMSHLPCFISAMMQCHMLAASFAADEEFLVLTANGKSLAPKFGEMLSLAHVTRPEDQARFHILGCEDVDGFDAVAKGEAVDVARVTPGIVALAKAAAARRPKVRAVLLECTELPPYADALRHALRIPVLDAITLVDFVHSASTDNPAFGVDFQKSSKVFV